MLTVTVDNIEYSMDELLYYKLSSDYITKFNLKCHEETIFLQNMEYYRRKFE